MMIKQHNHGMVGASLHPPKVEPIGNNDSGGYSSLASTPVSNFHKPSIAPRAIDPVLVRSTPVKVKSSKNRKFMNLPSSTVPIQPVINARSKLRNGEVPLSMVALSATSIVHLSYLIVRLP